MNNHPSAVTPPARSDRFYRLVYWAALLWCAVVSAPAFAFTGVTVTTNPPSPNGWFVATRSLDITSTAPNLCSGSKTCSLRIYALGDKNFPESIPNHYITADDKRGDGMAASRTVPGGP